MSLSKVSFTVLLVIFAVFLFMYVIFKALQRFAAVTQEDMEQDDDRSRTSSVLVIIESAAFVGFCRDTKVRQAAIDHEIRVETFRREMNCIDGGLVEQEQDSREHEEEVLTTHVDDDQHDEEDKKSLHDKKVISKKEQQLQLSSSSAAAASGNKNYSHINEEREEEQGRMQVHFLPPRGVVGGGDGEMATTSMMKKVNAAGADILLGNKMTPSSSPPFDSFKDNDCNLS